MVDDWVEEIGLDSTAYGTHSMRRTKPTLIYRQIKKYYRLFMAPGGTGNRGPGSYDSMPYLERWVEQGIAPTSVLAWHRTGGIIDRTRPLCPYPATAIYNGSGSIDDATNFTCSDALSGDGDEDDQDQD